jgi:hypothetical protein
MPLALILAATLSGSLLTYAYDEDAPVAARLCAGACAGLALFGLVVLLLAMLSGLTTPTLILALLAISSPLALALNRRLRASMKRDAVSLRRAIFSPSKRAVAYAVFYALASIFLWSLFDRAMFEESGVIYTGVLNNFGDLPFHVSIITRFVYGGNFPPEDPTFAGAPFTYPFLSDLIAASLMVAGASLSRALFLENFVLAVALVGLLHRLALKLTGDRVAAIITPLLVLLSGGLGWVLLLHDARETELGLIPLLRQLPHDYTIIPGTAWRWGNALTTLLVPQRGMLLGLPLAVIVITEWWQALSETESEAAARRRMAAAGVVAGLLPLAHAHSFAVVMGAGLCLALLFRRWRAWVIFFTVAILIALPQIWWVTQNSPVSARTFFGWHFGWDRGGGNFFWFWFKNTGLLIPLIGAALLWRGKKRLVTRRLLLFYLPFALCFALANLVKLAPWVWDNIKVLFYWYVVSTPIVALLLARLWRGSPPRRKLAVALIASLTLAGGLDVLRVITRASEYVIFDEASTAFASFIMKETAARSLILHAPTYNHPVFLTGRRSLMGYPGHIWTHGIDYAPRQAEIARIYAGEPDAEALMARYGISYAVVGPLERMMMPINDSFFESYTKVGQSGEYRLYKIEHR